MEHFCSHYVILLHDPDLRRALVDEAQRPRPPRRRSSTFRRLRVRFAQTLVGLAARDLLMTLHTVDTLRLAAALTAAVLVALPASAPLATPAVAHPSSHLETYKVLTYNVAGMDLPSPITPATPLDIGDLNVYSHMDLSVRAHLIAARILGGAYDIVVL